MTRRTPKELEKIGQTISRIGKDIPGVQTISVETKEYKAVVSRRKNEGTSSGMSAHLSLVYFISSTLLGIAVNIISGYLSLIPDAYVRNVISVLFLLLGIYLGYWRSNRQDNE